MSFNFRKLTIDDWRAYGGKVVLEFPAYKRNKNIIVVHGRNGAGKTSLLRALEYIFHGIRQSDWIENWHDNAKDNRTGQMKVILEFEYNDRLHVLSRHCDFKPHGSTISAKETVELWIDDVPVLDQIEDKIQQIIPKQCQQFVFFDGAEITRYAQRQHSDGVKDAIEQVLGIPAVRNLKYDLGKLINDLENEQEEILISESKNESLIFQIDSLKDDLDGYESEIQTIEETASSLDVVVQKLEKESAQIEMISHERARLIEKKERQADLEEQKKELNDKISNILSNAAVIMLRPQIEELTQQYKIRQKSRQKHQSLKSEKTLLANLLDEMECLCGRDIDTEVTRVINSKIERLNKQIDFGEKQEQSQLTNDTYLKLTKLTQTLFVDNQNGADLSDRRSTIEDQLGEVATDIKNLDAKLDGHELADVRELFAQIKQYKEERDNSREKLGGQKKKRDEISNEIKQKQRELDQLASDNIQGQSITRTLIETRKLYEATNELLNEMVKERRSLIEELASQIFGKITNKPLEYAGIRVKEDYTLEVFRRDGSTVENNQLSAGEKEVLAYSFITALNLSSQTPSPFVMDTPFGHLDSGHRDNLLRSLPQLSVQVFLLATDRDLPDEERESINDLISAEFVINRDQNKALSYIVEAD